MKVSRRRLLRGATAAAIGFPMLNFGSYQVLAGSPKRYSARVMRVMERCLVIDMLAALRPGFDMTAPEWSRTLSQPDRDDFRRSGASALHQSRGIGGPDAYERALVYMAACNGFVARNADMFLLVDRAGDIDHAKQTGKIAVLMGIQNAEHFRTVEEVARFHALGLRSAQLTYNSQNRLASGATDRIDGGISDYGVEIIGRMNEVGMLVDVSHCGDVSTLQAIEVSRGPVAITHSNCRALNDHPRLKTDEAIRKLAGRGGVMGITGVRNFVRDREPTTIEHMIDHIDHVVKLVGIEHVGIGSDSDLHGADDMPPEQLREALQKLKSSMAFRDKLDTDGFDDPLRFYDLTAALARRGYSDASIEAILGGNFRRLLGEVWKG